MQNPVAITQERYRELKASPEKRISDQAFICRHCHKHFRIGSYYTQFCCAEHEEKFKGASFRRPRHYTDAELNRPSHDLTFKCPTCNKHFSPKRRDQFYCSSPCRAKAFQEKLQSDRLSLQARIRTLEDTSAELIRENSQLRHILGELLPPEVLAARLAAFGRNMDNNPPE